MKMTRKMTIAAIALLMLLTGCGAESTGTESIETVVNINQTETTEPAAETAEAAVTETETVTEVSTESDAYAYLSVINADYESCYASMKHDACVVDGKAYFYAVAANPDDFGNLNDEKGFYSCDVSTGETRCIVPYEKDMEHVCYGAGQIYAIVDKEVRCYDPDGNLLKSFSDTADLRWDNDFEIQAVLADGSCVIGVNNFKYHYLIAPDFTSAKLVAETTEGVHGMTEEDPYSYIIGGRGNILYVAESSMKKVFYGIDVTTGEKTECAIPEDAPGMGAEWVQLFGNGYYKTQDNSGTAIMDMEAGEIIAELDGLTETYYGGEYFYKERISDSVTEPYAKLTITKYPANGGESESRELYAVDNNDTLFTILNAEYYLVTDEYGTFLRNIDSEEEIPLTFE